MRGSGSNIKGHHKLGDHWKEKRNGHYTSLLRINEHDSSQTCVRCFRKLSQLLTGKSRPSRVHLLVLLATV